MTCDEIRGLLDEYHDRELEAGRAEAVRAHVGGCAACSAELKALESLDRALRSAPARTDDVKWDHYVDQVRRRTEAPHRPGWKALIPVAAAAALVFAFARALPDERPILDRYAAASDAERKAIEKQIAAMNREALAPLAVAMVADGDPARRLMAARLLAPRLKEPDIQQLLLDRSREQEERDTQETVLIDLGFEPGDEDLVAPAIDMARSSTHEADAIRILRRIDRGTLNRKGHSEIVRRLRELLASDSARDRQLAVRLAGELEILIEDVVEFLDVPGLDQQVLEFLKRRTGKDFGRDKDAWRAWFARRGM